MLGGLVSLDDATMPVLFMDTEGLFASEASAEQDAEVFALAVLLCDTLLYNSTGAISQDAISTLALACKLAHKVSSSSQSSISASPPPACLQWVLRDFSLELVDEEGDPLTPQEYMQAALQSTRAASRDAARANAARSVIAAVFPERRCAVLPPPCDEPSKLSNGAAAPRAAFERQVKELRAAVLRMPNRNAVSVTGAALLQLARSYVDSVNAGAVPSLGSAWRSATQAACTAALHSAIQEVDSTPLAASGAAVAVLRNHAAACAAAHSRLTQGTAGFEWEPTAATGGGGGDSPHAAWRVSRPMAASCAPSGDLLLHLPAAEQLLWAVHDGALPPPRLQPGQGAGSSGTTGSYYKLHSATWERQLQAWGLPVLLEGGTVRGPHSAACALQGTLLKCMANAVYDAHGRRQAQLLEDFQAPHTGGEGGGTQYWGTSKLPPHCSAADGLILCSSTAEAAFNQLHEVEGAHARVLAALQAQVAEQVAEVARGDAAAQSQLRALREQEQQVNAAQAGTREKLAATQLQIVQALQRVSALQSQRRAAAAAADDAQQSRHLAEQERQLQIQATKLRAQRVQDHSKQQKEDAERAAAAAAAADRAAAAAAKAQEAAAAATYARDKQAAQALRHAAAPEEIDEGSAKSAGCCVVQ